MTEKTENKLQQQNNSHNNEEEKSFSESLTEFIIKAKPYVLILWKNKWRFVIFNSVVLVFAVLYLLFLTKPYYRSSVTILPDYGNKSSAVLGQLSGLASLAGVSVGEAPPTQIYQNLITLTTEFLNLPKTTN